MTGVVEVHGPPSKRTCLEDKMHTGSTHIVVPKTDQEPHTHTQDALPRALQTNNVITPLLNGVAIGDAIIDEIEKYSGTITMQGNLTCQGDFSCQNFVTTSLDIGDISNVDKIAHINNSDNTEMKITFHDSYDIGAATSNYPDETHKARALTLGHTDNIDVVVLPRTLVGSGPQTVIANWNYHRNHRKPSYVLKFASHIEMQGSRRILISEHSDKQDGIGETENYNLGFYGHDGTLKAWIDGGADTGNVLRENPDQWPVLSSLNNFTGQHRTFVTDVPYRRVAEYTGLIVSASSNQYIRMSGGIARGREAITINESLPVVALSQKPRDKACFGVVSTAEDPNQRTDAYGNLRCVFAKEDGDTRVYINSLGEGAIWVINTAGPLESGDYITTSEVPGYGQRQSDDVLHNYTVAKITQDCDFDPPMVAKLRIKRTTVRKLVYVTRVRVKVTEEEYNTLPPDQRSALGDGLYEKIVEEVSEVAAGPDATMEERDVQVNVLDDHGQLQWEETGDVEPAYDVRYLDATGARVDKEQSTFTAAFVGCTYHCG